MPKKHSLIFLFCLFAIFSDVMPSLADTTVGGVISSDTTWTLAGSPYIVTSTVQVYGTSTTPVTLTIQPGVVVKFAASAALQIGSGTNKGALIAQGTTASRITFTRNAISGAWSGISFQAGTVNATTNLENVDIQYSTGVTLTSCSPTIRNSTITNVTGTSLSLSSANPTIDTVTISGTGSYGIYLSSSSPTITNSTITTNGSYGIYLASSSPTISSGSLTNTSTSGYGIYGSGSPVISNYTVSSANSTGIYGLYLSGPTSALSVTNSTITNGLYIGSTGIVPTITGNTFTNLDNSPIHAGANIIGQIIANNTITNLTSAGKIEVVGEQINQDAVWKKQPAPYVVTSGSVSVYKDTSTAATLTIEPGTIVKFASGSGLQIGTGTSKGALVAKGTESDRITFTRNAASGNWGSIGFQTGATVSIENTDIRYSSDIYLYTSSSSIKNSTIKDISGSYGIFGGSANPVLENVTVTTTSPYGMYLSSSSPIITGGSLTNSNATGYGIYGNGSPVISNYTVSIANSAGKYGLYLSSTSSSLSVTNSTISNGLYIGSTGIVPTFTGNTFTNLDNSPIHAGANVIASILGSNTITGLSSSGRIEVIGEQVNQDAVWKKQPAPYVVTSGTVSVYKDTTTAATLTIEPGTIVKFASGAGLQVGSGSSKGALVAKGTESGRITFTRNAASGNWGNINLQTGATTSIENADIQYSSDILLYTSSSSIKNSTIKDIIGSYGINFNSANPLLENVTVTTTSPYGMLLNSSSPIITGGSLTNSNTTGYGIYGNGSPVISNYTVSIVNSAGKYGLYLSSASSSLSVTNSTIGNGLYLGSGGFIPTITGNTFTNLDNSPIHAGANVIASILGSNTMTGLSSSGRIEVTGEQVNQDAVWKKQPAPYVVTSGTVLVYKDTSTAATLTIEPGTIVKFASGTGLQVGTGTSKGALVARGTESDRITFTRNAASGNWGNIYLQATATASIENADIQYSSDIFLYTSSSSIKNSTIKDITGSYGINFYLANPVLENVTVTTTSPYGMYLGSSSPIITGGSLTNSNSTGYGIYGNGSPVISNYTVSIVNSAGKYGLYLSGASSLLSVTNSTIGNGLYLGSGGYIPIITGNTFTNSDNSPPHAGANIITDLLSNNTFNNLSSANRIEIVGEQVTRNIQWKKYVAPYVVLSTLNVYKDTTTASTLTIDPGVTVKFAQNTALNIGSGSNKGVLVANGTAALPILFTSNQATPAAGNWYGLNFSGDAASTSTLHNIIVEYCGSGGVYNNAGITLVSSSPTITNAVIRNSAGSGIYLSNATSIPKILDSTITANKWGVYSDSSNPQISNSKIYGNTTAGVWNSSTIIDIDARGNWWGTATGPSNASNPSGTGNAVSSKVLFNPWLGQTPSSLSITNDRITPAAFNPAGDSTTISAAISASATWKITITDSNAITVNTFTGSGTAINQVWSGVNSANAKVADGTYNVLIEATDASANMATPILGTIKISSAIPVAIVNTPADNLMVQGGATLDIYATASDATDFKNYTLECGSGEAPTSWISLVGATTTQPNNAKIYSWNTSSYTGGVYTLRLTATDTTGNTQVKTARVRLLWISSNSQTEAYISPNNDGIKDATTINATSTQPADWSIAISNSGNSVVRTLATTNTTTLSQAWDGKDSAGTIVPDGTYTYKIIVTDSASGVQSTPKTGTILSDITTPSATISSPLPGGLLRNSVIVTGTASDTNIASYTLDYGPSDGNGPWTAINSATSSVSSATLGTWITNDQGGTVPLANGSYQLRLVATDKAGNSAGFMIPVTADNLILSGITANSHLINTNSAQTSTIQYSINAPATVTFNIIPEKLGVNGTAVYQTSATVTTAGTYSFTWDGKDGTGKVVPDEAYRYALDAVTGSKTDSYNPPVPTGTGSVTCTQSTGFDPLKNLPMTVTYSLMQPARVNIYVGGYKVLNSFPAMPGTNTFDWDGRSMSNELLNAFVSSSCSIQPQVTFT